MKIPVIKKINGMKSTKDRPVFVKIKIDEVNMTNVKKFDDCNSRLLLGVVLPLILSFTISPSPASVPKIITPNQIP